MGKEIREIIAESELPYHDDVRREVNILLTKLFDSKEKELEEALEEDCCVQSPITIASHHWGIGVTYNFSTVWGTVVATIGDSDHYVSFEKDQTLKLIKHKLPENFC